MKTDCPKTAVSYGYGTKSKAKGGDATFGIVEHTVMIAEYDTIEKQEQNYSPRERIWCFARGIEKVAQDCAKYWYKHARLDLHMSDDAAAPFVQAQIDKNGLWRPTKRQRLSKREKEIRAIMASMDLPREKAEVVYDQRAMVEALATHFLSGGTVDNFVMPTEEPESEEDSEEEEEEEEDEEEE